MNLLGRIFEERVISPDYFFWGAAKSTVHQDNPKTIDDLKLAWQKKKNRMKTVTSCVAVVQLHRWFRSKEYAPTLWSKQGSEISYKGYVKTIQARQVVGSIRESDAVRKFSSVDIDRYSILSDPNVDEHVCVTLHFC
ncbi:hypothetical protein ANN_06668 [Periplaneta americana]|uniref:Uncharacterized protein n=1 Tax=Periplaneta americana TaxID=6978 RepID=A0ABQ8TFT0_PERAM|nr:hypothetical protein ANN_06668 [Periplaneta americana]